MNTTNEKEILSFEAWCQQPGLDHRGKLADVEGRHAALEACYGDAVATLATYKAYHYHRYLNKCGLNARDQVPYMQSIIAAAPKPEGPKVLWSILHTRELAEKSLRDWDAVTTLPQNTGHEIVLTPRRPFEVGSRVRVSKSAKKSTYGKPLWLLEILE